MKMIIFMLGTTAELIKLRPVIDRCLKHTDNVEIWCTAQQYTELTSLPDVVSYLRRRNTKWLSRGHRSRSISRAWHVPTWFLMVVARFARLIFSARSRHRVKLVIVHGDTITTAIGAILGRLTRCSVAHVEAGLRSGDWRNPFPEEICRRIVGKVADYHFAPSPHDAQNLSATRGHVVVTNGNTAVDNLEVTDSEPPATDFAPCVLVLLHRVEFLSNRSCVQQSLKVLLGAAQFERITVVVDSLAMKSIKELPEFHDLSVHTNVQITPKLPHSEFLDLLRRVRLVVTDSGGVQEEAASLGVPCIIHRVVSERRDGLEDGGNAALTGLDPDTLEHLLKNPPPKLSARRPDDSPSDIVVETLQRFGLLT